MTTSPSPENLQPEPSELLERDALHVALQEAVEHSPGAFAVVELDLDSLKDTNDTKGHKAGDELIDRFGKFLSDNVRGKRDDATTDTIGVAAHRSGDEFTVILLNTADQTAVTAFITRIQAAANLQAMGVSAGGRVHQVGETVEQLLDDADLSLRENKQKRKLEKYEADQLAVIKEIGMLAAEHEISLRDIPTVLAALRNNLKPND